MDSDSEASRLKVDEGFSWTVGRILVRRVCKFSWNVPVNRPLTHGGSVQQNKAKTTMANHKRPATESSPTAPAAKRVCISESQSISTLLADVQTEFQRREEEKEALFMKWAKEGTLLKSLA
jgi:hypothetical protein